MNKSRAFYFRFRSKIIYHFNIFNLAAFIFCAYLGVGRRICCIKFKLLVFHLDYYNYSAGKRDRGKNTPPPGGEAPRLH